MIATQEQIKAAQEKEDERRIEKVQGAVSVETAAETDGQQHCVRCGIATDMQQVCDRCENLATEADGVAGHTPGPWEISESKVPGYSRVISIIDRARLSVCTIDGAGSYNPKVIQSVRANARLIASAPDLFAERDMLKAVVSDPQRWRRWCDSRVLEENEALKDAALKESDMKLLTEIYEHFDQIADGAPDSSHAALMANRFSDPLQRLIKKLG